MKGVMTAAFTLSLLATTAMAQEQGRPGPEARPAAPHAQAAPERAPQAQARPQQQPRFENRGNPGGQQGPRNFDRGDFNRGQRSPNGVAAPQSQPQTQNYAQPRREFDRRGQDGRDGRDGRDDRGRQFGNPAFQGNPGFQGGQRPQARDQRREGEGPSSQWTSRGEQARPAWARPDGRGDRDRNRPRFDSRRYPHVFFPNQRFRAPFYRPPYGFYNRVWQFGDFLPFGWYGPDYWIDDWDDFGLPIPPVGFEWVRVGGEALLIDMYNGQIEEVVPDLFW